MAAMLKAYLVKARGFEDGLVWAETRGKALWATVRLYCEMYGCKPREALDVLRIRRALAYDGKYLTGDYFLRSGAPVSRHVVDEMKGESWGLA